MENKVQGKKSNQKLCATGDGLNFFFFFFKKKKKKKKKKEEKWERFIEEESVQSRGTDTH
jgi:hypothetical protein